MNNDPSKLPTRIAIIGGGISGLTACFQLQQLSKESGQPVQIDLFEANEKFGGVFGTVEKQGYHIETGADMFITNKPGVLNLVKKLGIENRLVETQSQYRRSFILRNGKPVPTPKGFDLMVPRNILPLLTSPLLSVAGKLRLLAEPLIASNFGKDETLSQFVTRRFGREAFDRIVQPMIGGIYTADPEKLSLQATLPRFLEMEKEHGSLLKAVWKDRKKEKGEAIKNDSASGARYGLFLSFDDGMSVLQNALINRIRSEENAHLQIQTSVEKIEKNDPTSHQYQLTLTDGKTKSYEKIILAIPSHVASKLTASVNKELSQSLAEIEYASAAIVVSGHRLQDISHPMEAFGVVIPAVEKRNILAVSFTSRKFLNRAPEGSIQLRTFLGGAMQEEILKHSDDELTEIALRELRDIFGISGTPELTQVVRWNKAMPQYHLGHVARVAKIREQVDATTGFEIAGNSMEGVGLPDVIHTAESAAKRLWNKPYSGNF